LNHGKFSILPLNYCKKLQTDELENLLNESSSYDYENFIEALKFVKLWGEKSDDIKTLLNENEKLKKLMKKICPNVCDNVMTVNYDLNL
jgi:hypothetical protein